jgi:hypothetical protein
MNTRESAMAVEGIAHKETTSGGSGSAGPEFHRRGIPLAVTSCTGNLIVISFAANEKLFG